MKIQHVLSITLSLSLMACQVGAPLVSTPEASSSRAGAAVQLPVKPTAFSVDHKARLQFDGNTEQVRLQLNTSGFRTQLVQPEQLAFIKVTLVGEGIATPITQDGDEFLPVNGGSINATLSNIPTDNGKLRLVRVEGFNASQEPLEAFEASAWYRSQTGVTTVNLTLNRAQNLLYDLLNTLLTERTTALAGLDIAALQTLLSEVLDYNAQTGEFGQDPSLFDGTAMATLITGGQPLPDASTLAGNTVALFNITASISTQDDSVLPELVRFVLSDPLSKPAVLAAGSSSGSFVSFDQVTPGNWLLSAYGSDGTLLASTEISVVAGQQPVLFSLMLPSPRDEFKVNTYTTGSQQRSKVAMDADGDFAVVWISSQEDGSAFDVYGQRYNAAGVAQGSEFRVNTYTTGNQVLPSVAMDADGDFVVAWQSRDQEGGGVYSVYGQRYNAAGVAQGSEFRVNAYTTGFQSGPSVAMDADGDFMVTWNSYNQDGSSNGIYGQRYNAAGVAQGSEFRVNTYTTNNQTQPSVAMDADGDFVVTWNSSGQDGSDTGIYGQRYNAAGVAQGSEFRVNTYTNGDQLNPSVGMDADGDFVVTWQSRDQDGNGNGIYGQRYNASGVAQDSEFRVNTHTTSFQVSASVAMDADGDFVAAWQSYSQDGSLYGIYGQRYNTSGVAQGSEFRVNTYTTGNQERSAVAIDTDGDFVITWGSNGQDGDDLGIYSKQYQANGRTK